ncbi:MAG: hypothetical protein K2P53_05200 [Rickettsiales bacterium]|jgi:hypothetical protein|nr:hypothetical protein [Rickettsiales bacterium]
MNKEKTINSAIKMLSKLKSNPDKKGAGKHKKSRNSGFSLRKWLIILVVLFGLFTVVRIYYAKGIFNTLIELWENAGVDIGAFDEKDTRRYQRKQREAVLMKKEGEIKQMQEEEVKAKKSIYQLKDSYLDLQDEYSSYVDIEGYYKKGVVKTEYNKSVIKKYRDKQYELVAKLEECEYLIENTVRTHIKKAKSYHKEIEEIKVQVGELALKGQKGLSEEEIEKLDTLAGRIKSINKWQLVTDREKLILAFFESNQAVVNNCPCVFIISQLWGELRKDKYFMKEIVPLRLKMHMQEYMHTIWKMEIMENKLN